MADVEVTVVFMIPAGNKTYKKMEFNEVTINPSAPANKLIPALVKSFPEAQFDEDAELLVQAPDGSPLTNMKIESGSRLVLFPRYNDDIVKRRK